MKLTSLQFALLHEALTASYLDFQSMQMAARLKLGRKVDDIASGLSPSEGFFRLMERAEADGRLGDIVELLIADKPNNEKVIELLKSLGRKLDKASLVCEAFISKLPATDETLIGRDRELASLENSWTSNHVDNGYQNDPYAYDEYGDSGTLFRSMRPVVLARLPS